MKYNFKKVFFISFIAIVFAILFVCFCIKFHKTTKNMTENISPIICTSKISGKIIELNIEENSIIKKGEIIAKIDCSECKNTLENAEKNLENFQNELKISKNKITKIKNEILNKEKNIDNAKAQLERANSDYIIYKNAYSDGSVTKKDMDNAIKNLEIAKLEFEKTQDELNISKKELNEITTKKISQNIQIKKMISEIEQAKLNLSYTTLISPTNGKISNLKIKIGDNVKTNENILMIIPNK